MRVGEHLLQRGMACHELGRVRLERGPQQNAVGPGQDCTQLELGHRPLAEGARPLLQPLARQGQGGSTEGP